MRIFSSFLLALLLLPGLVGAQTALPQVGLQGPHYPQVLTKGQTYPIRWIVSNPPADYYFAVTLYKGTALHSELATTSAASRSYSWLVPTSLIDGSDYKITVSMLERATTSIVVASSTSDGFFSVRSATTTPPAATSTDQALLQSLYQQILALMQLVATLTAQVQTPAPVVTAPGAPPSPPAVYPAVTPDNITDIQNAIPAAVRSKPLKDFSTLSALQSALGDSASTTPLVTFISSYRSLGGSPALLAKDFTTVGDLVTFFQGTRIQDYTTILDALRRIGVTLPRLESEYKTFKAFLTTLKSDFGLKKLPALAAVLGELQRLGMSWSDIKKEGGLQKLLAALAKHDDLPTLAETLKTFDELGGTYALIFGDGSNAGNNSNNSGSNQNNNNNQNNNQNGNNNNGSGGGSGSGGGVGGSGSQQGGPFSSLLGGFLSGGFLDNVLQSLLGGGLGSGGLRSACGGGGGCPFGGLAGAQPGAAPGGPNSADPAKVAGTSVHATLSEVTECKEPNMIAYAKLTTKEESKIKEVIFPKVTTAAAAKSSVFGGLVATLSSLKNYLTGAVLLAQSCTVGPDGKPAVGTSCRAAYDAQQQQAAGSTSGNSGTAGNQGIQKKPTIDEKNIKDGAYFFGRVLDEVIQCTDKKDGTTIKKGNKVNMFSGEVRATSASDSPEAHPGQHWDQQLHTWVNDDAGGDPTTSAAGQLTSSGVSWQNWGSGTPLPFQNAGGQRASAASYNHLNNQMEFTWSDGTRGTARVFPTNDGHAYFVNNNVVYDYSNRQLIRTDKDPFLFDF